MPQDRPDETLPELRRRTFDDELGRRIVDTHIWAVREGLRGASAHDLFDAHLPLLRYEQQPGAGLAVRKYVLQKRGIIASGAQRKPGAGITPAAKAEVDYLLSRVARVDRRANLQPQSSAAG